MEALMARLCSLALDLELSPEVAFVPLFWWKSLDLKMVLRVVLRISDCWDKELIE